MAEAALARALVDDLIDNGQVHAEAAVQLDLIKISVRNFYNCCINGHIVKRMQRKFARHQK